MPVDIDAVAQKLFTNNNMETSKFTCKCVELANDVHSRRCGVWLREHMGGGRRASRSVPQYIWVPVKNATYENASGEFGWPASIYQDLLSS